MFFFIPKEVDPPNLTLPIPCMSRDLLAPIFFIFIDDKCRNNLKIVGELV